MKYLVNRQTKEHEVYDGQNYDAVKYRAVEADAEGWIKWDGGECPLPENYPVALKFKGNNFKYTNHLAGDWAWEDKTIEAYRPILDKPEVIRPTASEYQSVADSILRDKRDQLYTADGVQVKPQAADIITRLKSAHEAAQSIPDLLAELREVLAAMGYDLVARSPFVERTDSDNDVVKPESGTETPQDMSDWRNWKPGDLVTWQPGAITYPWWTPGKLYEVTLRNGELVVIADDGDFYNISGKRLSNGSRFRFYSRQKVKS